ncbi:variable surface lipoprotein [Mycoplasmopsis agalactiae]|nr:variable surface lipoprotein [Mycoplasmopsis agalactiae]MCE6115502.1 variable surface lipoprotein [Mycoplasmopsis agalactiae]
MKKKIKSLIYFSSLSFLPLMPLVAASCKKKDISDKNNEINKNPDANHSHQMTPPLILMAIKAGTIQVM